MRIGITPNASSSATNAIRARCEKLAVFDGAEGVLEVYLPGADRLDLGPEKLDPGFKALKHEVFMESLAILRDLLGTGLLRHFSHILPGAISAAQLSL